MYLSRLILNVTSRQARQDVRSPYSLHQTLAHAFPTPEGVGYRQRHHVLFRLESPLGKLGVLDSTPSVLVQSSTLPQWDHLPTHYLSAPAQLREYHFSSEAGQEYSFCLVANPSRKQSVQGKKHGRRIALPDLAESDQLPFGLDPCVSFSQETPARRWLFRKGQQYGFQIRYLASHGFWWGNYRQENKSFQKDQIPIYGVKFEGLLQVTVPHKFVEGLNSGIGPAKAFGFGLLSLVNPR